MPYLTPVPSGSPGGQGNHATSALDCLARSSREPIWHDSRPPNASCTPRAASAWPVWPYWPLGTSSPPSGVNIHPLAPPMCLAGRPGRGLWGKSSGSGLCREWGQRERRRMEPGHRWWGWPSAANNGEKASHIQSLTLFHLIAHDSDKH